ncbi:hypothetical protein [Porphyromonas circumdentaria]|uniref:Por secretion system C-terminal sorting domain-containing protein n=1 Tax=Porphyromonas circumdentaria TaxID=29524 RepID=A0A1T4LR58_9PORP|nr:hypothetical protein [Porphyromonas circumdentaria]MBB6275476.1 hypothetical protein [Porphyromonas circumdentaria]SJZ57175.1 hypothetical protein SAMN02745171_00492 [Porphyromonas circumdentaria]
MKRIFTHIHRPFVGLLILLLLGIATASSVAQSTTGNGVIKMKTNAPLGSKIELGIKANGNVEFDGLAGKFQNDQFFNYTVIKNEITLRGDITVFICAEAQITWLDVSGCPTIDEINCYDNLLFGEATDALIEGLPDRSALPEPGLLLMINTKEHPNDQNRCTMAQVDAAQAKGWHTQEWDGGFWIPFIGSDATKGTGIISFTTNKPYKSRIRIGGRARSLVEIKGARGKWLNGRLFGVELRDSEVSLHGDLTMFVADSTGMVALDASKMPMLEELYCTLNHLKGKALDNLIASLPDRSEKEKRGIFALMDFTSPNTIEYSICTKAQVAAAAKRGWDIVEWREELDKFMPYEGTDPLPTHPVTVECGEGGKIRMVGADDLNNVPEGSELWAIVSHKREYELVSFTANDIDLRPTDGRFTVTGPTVVKATFREKVCNVTLHSEGPGTISIEGYNEEQLKKVKYGQVLRVVAEPQQGIGEVKLKTLTVTTEVATGDDIVTDILISKEVTTSSPKMLISAVFEKVESVEKVAEKGLVVRFEEATGSLQILHTTPLSRVELYSIEGELLLTAMTNEGGTAQIDVAQLPEALYIVRVGDEATKVNLR